MNRLAEHFPLDAAWSVAMPNTYVPMFDLDDEAPCRKKIENARLAITSIVEDVIARKKAWNVHEGGAALAENVCSESFVCTFHHW